MANNGNDQTETVRAEEHINAVEASLRDFAPPEQRPALDDNHPLVRLNRAAAEGYRAQGRAAVQDARAFADDCEKAATNLEESSAHFAATANDQVRRIQEAREAVAASYRKYMEGNPYCQGPEQ